MYKMFFMLDLIQLLGLVACDWLNDIYDIYVINKICE